MKFLQTSDWHLGKTFHEVNLYEDQQFFLDQIFDELKKEKENGSAYDGFLVPGDIYDRPIPPSDAVTMLSSFLGKIHKEFPELEIFLLSGNHDSAERLSFLKGILSELKIHIKTDVISFMEPVLLEKGNEKCAVYQLPFLYSGAFFDESGNSIKKQDDLYKFACEKIFQAHSQNCPDSSSVICAHLMTVKSIVSDSERSCVGTAEEVNASYFECFDYSAVGHLHSYQTAGKKKNVVYSGAPLAYSFDDKDERFKMYEWLETLEFKLLELEVPDIRLFLHMPYDAALELRKGRLEEADQHEASKEHLINSDLITNKLQEMSTTLYNECKLLLEKNYNKVERLATKLLEVETLSGDDILQLIGDDDE